MNEKVQHISLARNDWQQHNNTYISKILDSSMESCRWHRIVLEDMDVPVGSTLTVSFNAADFKLKGTGIDWCGETRFIHGDIPEAVIKAPPGRYLRLKLEFYYPDANIIPALPKITACYPRPSFPDYLPEIYRHDPGNEFFNCFIALFESLFYDVKEKVAGIHKYFHPKTAPAGFIQWLAQWVSLDLYELLGDRNREFILQAAEFYKKKGTVGGIAELVTFLTGKKCCVKEYMNNIFRTYGMEHEGENVPDTDTGDHGACIPFYRTVSESLDTKKPELLSKMGTCQDEVHYTVDTKEDSLYTPNVIGLFVFLTRGEEEFSIKKDELYRIIASFLPVFVRAVMILVIEDIETYEIGSISDTFKDQVLGYSKEEFKDAAGDYQDTSGKILYSLRDTVNGKSNDSDYRSFHCEFNVKKLL